MVSKQWHAILILFLLSVQNAIAALPLGQTLQININLSTLKAPANWTLIIHDLDNQQIIPYFFDLTKNQHYWIAFTYGNTYRIKASQLRIGQEGVINNFCHLESNTLSDISMNIQLQGILSKNPKSYTCQVLRYRN